MRSTYNGKPEDLHVVLCGVAATALLIVAVISGSLWLANALRPQTGDIITFDPSKRATNEEQTTITARTVGNSSVVSCVLEPRLMQATGGSLVIEATQFGSDVSYKVHWAGGRTSGDGADCSSSADLLLSPANLATLSLAAGGWG